MLQGQRILLGVTGSISAYKACDLVQRLKEKGAEVRVVMTASATRLINPNTFSALTGFPAAHDVWEEASKGRMTHIELARWATAFVIAPCTAHTLAELAHGLTGSIVSMTALASDRPLIVAPAMNTVMLDSASAVENARILADRGVHLLPTASGDLACGEVGEGKLISPVEIAQYVDLVLSFGAIPKLSGLRVSISGGHTEEPLDGVRFLSNRSSGKTAMAIARAFRLTGADVRLTLGLADEEAPSGMRVNAVKTSAEFRHVMLNENADVVIMAAAIADFVPAKTDSGKWKDSRSLKAVELLPAVNVLEELGKQKPPGQILVGFALETESPTAHALEKMKARRCDLMVVNTPLSQPGTGFGEDQVEAFILEAGDESEKLGPLSVIGKNHLAVDLVKRVAAKWKAKP